MYTLGIHGGINTTERFQLATPPNWLHDAAAVLCRDGDVVAAAEEERFVRIKHVTHFPLEAIRYCLASERITLDDVEKIVTSSTYMDMVLQWANQRRHATSKKAHPSSYHQFVTNMLKEEFGIDVSGKVSCAGHHLSHIASAVWQSGFDDCLCVVLDGWGDGLTGMVATFEENRLQILRAISGVGPAALYEHVTQLLGFKKFDEYKVMGLASYGNPESFVEKLRDKVKLEPEGCFEIRLPQGAEWDAGRRERHGEILQHHKDWAAALQRVTEDVLFHLLRHFKAATGKERLCLAGGVAQNCTANGKLLRLGLFADIFVQPVAYDAGCAAGAAIKGYIDSGRGIRRQRLQHVYLGSPVGDGHAIRTTLERWSGLIEYVRDPDIAATAADLIAQGHVIGWVQGRAEFGARALGNRSILADPRPRENQTRINAMIKKRESFRPFAPAVLEEHLHDYFEVSPECESLPFMLFTVDVKAHYRDLLGAVTHVDGSARVQSVSKDVNPRFWRLIDAFRRRTDVPIVLNTSFNNDAEPIVDTADDALGCFLSTDLDYLCVGDFLVRKTAISRDVPSLVGRLVPRANPRYALVHRSSDRASVSDHCLHDRYVDEYLPISRDAFLALQKALNERSSLGAAAEALQPSSPDALAAELHALWSRRTFFADGSFYEEHEEPAHTLREMQAGIAYDAT